VANYSLSVKPEIYYTYSLDAEDLTLGDFAADPQTWTSGQNEGKSFALAWETAHPTGTYYRVYRLKVTAKGSAITNCTMGIGGTDASYVTYDSSGEDFVALLDLKVDKANITTNVTSGTNTVPSNKAVLDVFNPYGVNGGTNYTAAIAWDATNKVFIVTETAQ
jgi:hypothetical protein